MSVRSGQGITVEFITSRFDTGAATNADSLPTGTLIVNGTDDAATVTVTNITTGRYKAAVTLPTLAVGDIVEMSISATVNSVAGKGIIWRDTKDILLDSSGDVTYNNAAPPTVAAIATAVWTDLLAGSDFGTASSIGKLLKDDIDAAISSRSSHTAADVWASATRTLTAFSFSVTVGVNNDKTGYSLSSSGLNSVLVDGKTFPAAMQIVAAAVAGKASGAGTGTETFIGLDQATTRFVVTVDASGNRSAVSYP